jgi:uncharacterized protein (TIGR03435 family)
MRKSQVVFGSRNTFFLAAAGLISFALPIVFGAAHAAPSRAQSQTQTQNVASTAPTYEYDVATIKPTKPSDNGVRSGINYPPDGFTVTGLTLQTLIQQAYGIQNYQLLGAPAWLNSERYDVDAKMDSSVADALQKLSPEDRFPARQKMLQALLADRLKLAFHRETKELPIYLLVTAKNGPKLKEAKPDNSDSKGVQGRGGRGGPGMSTTSRVGSESLTAQAVPISGLAQLLARYLKRNVVDKTGLTRNYDFTLQWATDESGMQPAPASGGAPPPESGGPTLSAALQEQLGLKLESGKGPVEIIVIDHVERPSGN